MPQSFLHAGQYRLFLADFGEDHPVGVQPGLRQRRGEEIAPRHAPEDLTRCARGDAGGEQRRSRPMDRTIAAASDLVERAQRRTAARNSAVHHLDPEWQHAARTLADRFDAGDLIAEREKLRVGGHRHRVEYI